MELGYLKTIESVIGVILIVLILVQLFPAQRTEAGWDYVSLQSRGQEAMMALYYSDLKEQFFSEDYDGLNQSLSGVIPAYINYNLKRDGSLIINNGDAEKPLSIVYFLSGNETEYIPTRLELILWYVE